MSSIRSCAAFVSVPLLVLACGGASSSTIDPLGASPDGGAAQDAAATTYTLDDVCERTAARTCALRKPCCEKTSGYDEAACLADAKSECAKDVGDARAGKATFHPELVDPCFAKLAPLFDSCSLTFELLARATKELPACRVFEGSVPSGGACTRDSECASGPAGSFPSCNEGTKTCTQIAFLASGAACSFTEPPTGFCDQGLFCDANLQAKPPAGTCKLATAVGKPCDAGKAIDLSCGLGNYCDKATAICAVGKGANAACDLDFECASFKCQQGVAGKRCAPPDVLVKPARCGKP